MITINLHIIDNCFTLIIKIIVKLIRWTQGSRTASSLTPCKTPIENKATAAGANICRKSLNPSTSKMINWSVRAMPTN